MSLTSLRLGPHVKGNRLPFLRNFCFHSEIIFDRGSHITRRNYSGPPVQHLVDDKLHKLIRKSKFLTRLNSNPRYAGYLNKLSEAGAVSTATSFLILHEITAIIPLFGLWWLLYSLDVHWQYELPVYFKDLLNRCGESIEKLIGNYDENWNRERLVLSGAISYAIVKLLYPVRVLLSLWGAPYLGRFIVRPFSKLKSILKR